MTIPSANAPRIDSPQTVIYSILYAWEMQPIQIRLCFAARQLARTHGTFYAASLLYEQSVPLEFARIFLTYSADDRAIR